MLYRCGFRFAEFHLCLAELSALCEQVGEVQAHLHTATYILDSTDSDPDQIQTADRSQPSEDVPELVLHEVRELTEDVSDCESEQEENLDIGASPRIKKPAIQLPVSWSHDPHCRCGDCEDICGERLRLWRLCVECGGDVERESVLRQLYRSVSRLTARSHNVISAAVQPLLVHYHSPSQGKPPPASIQRSSQAVVVYDDTSLSDTATSLYDQSMVDICLRLCQLAVCQRDWAELTRWGQEAESVLGGQCSREDLATLRYLQACRHLAVQCDSEDMSHSDTQLDILCSQVDRLRLDSEFTERADAFKTPKVSRKITNHVPTKSSDTMAIQQGTTMATVGITSDSSGCADHATNEQSPEISAPLPPVPAAPVKSVLQKITRGKARGSVVKPRAARNQSAGRKGSQSMSVDADGGREAAAGTGSKVKGQGCAVVVYEEVHAECDRDSQLVTPAASRQSKTPSVGSSRRARLDRLIDSDGENEVIVPVKASRRGGGHRKGGTVLTVRNDVIVTKTVTDTADTLKRKTKSARPAYLSEVKVHGDAPVTSLFPDKPSNPSNPSDQYMFPSSDNDFTPKAAKPGRKRTTKAGGSQTTARRQQTATESIETQRVGEGDTVLPRLPADAVESVSSDATSSLTLTEIEGEGKPVRRGGRRKAGRAGTLNTNTGPTGDTGFPDVVTGGGTESAAVTAGRAIRKLYTNSIKETALPDNTTCPLAGLASVSVPASDPATNSRKASKRKAESGNPGSRSQRKVTGSHGQTRLTRAVTHTTETQRQDSVPSPSSLDICVCVEAGDSVPVSLDLIPVTDTDLDPADTDPRHAESGDNVLFDCPELGTKIFTSHLDSGSLLPYSLRNPDKNSDPESGRGRSVLPAVALCEEIEVFRMPQSDSEDGTSATAPSAKNTRVRKKPATRKATAAAKSRSRKPVTMVIEGSGGGSQEDLTVEIPRKSRSRVSGDTDGAWLPRRQNGNFGAGNDIGSSGTRQTTAGPGRAGRYSYHTLGHHCDIIVQSPRNITG